MFKKEFKMLFSSKPKRSGLGRCIVASIVAAPLMVGASGANAALLTFDSLSGNAATANAIPDGYGGLTWDNFYTTAGDSFPDSGYASGVVSPDNVAYNGFGAPATISSTTPFSLESGYLTAAFNDGLAVDVVGSLGGVQQYAQLFTPSATAPTAYVFNSKLVDHVVFSSFGGALHPGYCCEPHPQFVLDNLVVATTSVPEPSSWALMIVGLGLVGHAMRRRGLGARSGAAAGQGA